MTIAEKTTSPRNDYIGNGSRTEFPFTFEVLNETNSLTGKNYSLKVILTTDGVEAEQIEDTDYTVNYDSSTKLGSITATAPASNVLVTLLSDISINQATDYINIGTGKFPAVSHEGTVDKLTLINRQQQEQLNRSILLPESSELTDITIPVSTANASKAIVVNSSGNNLEAQSLVDIDLYPISSFAETLVDDATAEEARTTLDAEQKANSLTAITSLEDDDEFIVSDDSDSGNSKKITLANMQGTTALRGVSYLPKRITVSNGTDADHDIDFTAGVFQFDDGTGQAIASAMTKQIDSAWSAGDAAGGLDTGTVANLTWYYAYKIYNPTSKLSDSLLSASPTSPTLPSGYTKSTRLKNCFFKTDASGNIAPFNCGENGWSLGSSATSAQQNLVSATSQTGSTGTLSGAFPAISIEAVVNMGLSLTASGFSSFTTWGNNQPTPTGGNPNTAGQIRASTIATNNSFSTSGIGIVYSSDGVLSFRNWDSSGGVSSIEVDLISIKEL